MREMHERDASHLERRALPPIFGLPCAAMFNCAIEVRCAETIRELNMTPKRVGFYEMERRRLKLVPTS